MRGKIVLGIVLLALAGLVASALNLPERLGLLSPHRSADDFYGNVDIRQVQLGFRVAGRLQAVEVDEGDSVKAGQLLARLDPQPYQDQVDAAKARISAAKATYDKLVAGPRPAEIDRAQAQVAQASADLTNAELAFDRTSRLVPSGAASKATLDQSRAARDMAQARLNSAKEDLRLLEEGTRAEDIAVGKASLEEAQANLEALQTSLADTQLKAPADGIILSRVEEPGAILAAGATVLTLSLTQPVWVRGYVPEPDLGRLHPGLRVEVISDSDPGHPFAGTVGYISPVAEFTPKSVETPDLRTALVYRFRVTVDHAPLALRQGMPVTIRIPRRDGRQRRSGGS